MRKTSEVLTLIGKCNVSLVKVCEYGESWYRDNYSKYPFNSDKGLKIASEWTLDLESKAYTYKGRVYIKFKHHTDDGCIVTWFRTRSRRFTAYNIAKALEVLFV